MQAMGADCNAALRTGLRQPMLRGHGQAVAYQVLLHAHLRRLPVKVESFARRLDDAPESGDDRRHDANGGLA